MIPHTPIHASLLSTKQLVTCSAIPPRPTESAPAGDRRTPDHAKEGVYADPASIADVEATFPGSSRVTSMGTIETMFLVNEEIVPIKIEKILGNYTLFKLVL